MNEPCIPLRDIGVNVQKTMLMIICSLLIILSTNSTMAMAIDTPQALVQQTSDTFLKALREQGQELDKDPQKIYRLVEEIILPHMDMQRISAWVLGKHWRRTNKQQREKFVAQFRQLLIRTYSTAMLNYSDLDITYLPVQMRNKDTRATVRAKISTPGGLTVPIHYNLYTDKKSWKVYDIQVDGISLVSTYRSSFSSQLRRAGMDQLIEQLAAQNDKLVVNEHTEISNN